MYGIGIVNRSRRLVGDSNGHRRRRRTNVKSGAGTISKTVGADVTGIAQLVTKETSGQGLEGSVTGLSDVARTDHRFTVGIEIVGQYVSDCKLSTVSGVTIIHRDRR